MSILTALGFGMAAAGLAVMVVDGVFGVARFIRHRSATRREIERPRHD